MFVCEKIYAGREIGRDALIARLLELGYRRCQRVEEEGDFACRGNVVDVFAFGFDLPVRIEFSFQDTIERISSFNPWQQPGPSWEHKIIIILPFKSHRRKSPLVFSEETPLNSYLDIHPGDYVVHTNYGIGRFLGLKRLPVGGKNKDCLVIEYANSEKLFVPVESMHLVQKYIAFQARRPKLSRLGSKEWERTKQWAKKGIQKMAWELLSLEAIRRSLAGFQFSPDTEWQEKFEAGFSYLETPDQKKATQQVKQDMESPRPMDRLLCGDVGYGKTEVAMRAAFKATMDNKQVAFLVPTTILAQQHYYNFLTRLKDFPINVAMLSRFCSPAQQRDIVEGIKQGRIDIVIGTHRLLSDDIVFKDLGLLIIDEEQRFGVRAKEKLKKMRLVCDVLTLTATPIPRTLYMGLMGLRDISIINTPPQNRLPVKTTVVEYDEEVIRQAAIQELKRQGQVYFVHNHIEDIHKLHEMLLRILPAGVSCAVAHGRMPTRTLERIVLDFMHDKIKVLLCTMIIESGIDIPNANTIIINNAHTFGLADLHQLRGRVGRFNLPAYAYLLVPRGLVLDSVCQKRLAAIQEYSQLGSGFHIAYEDLLLRGAGNLLGEQQHGFVNAVGFDLYCRLLRQIVEQIKRAWPTAQQPTYN